MTMMKGVKLVNFSFLDTYVPLFLRHPLNRAIWSPTQSEGFSLEVRGQFEFEQNKKFVISQISRQM